MIETGAWYPEREEWFIAEGDNLLFYDEALALLLCGEYIFPLVAQSTEGKLTIGLYVGCNDVFHWGCADCEELPLVGFRNEEESEFWDLYEKVRTKGSWGSVEWCCLRRQMRPQYPVMRDMKKAGMWTDELESLPERDM